VVAVDDRVIGLAKYQEEVGDALGFVERVISGIVFKVDRVGAETYVHVYAGYDRKQKAERRIVYTLADENKMWCKAGGTMDNVTPFPVKEPPESSDAEIEFSADQAREQAVMQLKHRREYDRLISVQKFKLAMFRREQAEAQAPIQIEATG
jgi:hypothetical protein